MVPARSRVQAAATNAAPAKQTQPSFIASHGTSREHRGHLASEKDAALARRRGAGTAYGRDYWH